MANYLNYSQSEKESEGLSLLNKRLSPYRLQSLFRKYPINGIKEDGNGNITAGSGGIGGENVGDGSGGGGVNTLNKCLSIVDIISYGIGSTVGAGVFVSIGIAINGVAGPATLLSFLFSAIACLISAFCYSEFSARIPVSGSAYTFTYVSLGEFMGWYIGWNLTLEYMISASAVARGWVNYLGVFFTVFGGSEAPQFIQGYPINSWINFNPFAPVIVIICTIILVFGIKDSARFNMIITAINICTILFFLVLGSFYVDPSNWTPFLPFGMDGVFNGCSIVFFSYVGFDSVSTLAGEVKNPKRDLPIGIVGTLVIATTLYIGVTLVLSGMVNFTMVSQDSPLSNAFLTVDSKLKWAAMIIACGTLTSLTASTLCCMLGQPRIYLQMAKDGLFFNKFKSLSKKQVPVFGTIFTGIFASLISIFIDLDNLTNMISIGTLMAFNAVCAGVVVLRYRNEDGSENGKISTTFILTIMFIFACLFGASSSNNWNMWIQISFAALLLITIISLYFKKQVYNPTTFKCPFVPALPCLGIIVNTYFIMHLDIASFVRLAVWTFIGILLYAIYGIRNSKLNQIQSSKNFNYVN